MALALNRFQTETKQLTTADQTIYTAPNGYTGIVLYAHVTNYGSSATTVTMSHKRSSKCGTTEIAKVDASSRVDDAYVIRHGWKTSIGDWGFSCR